MSDPAATAQREQVRQQSLIASLITLPFRLFGVMCGSLMVCILVECVGMHFFWPAQGWHHAQGMLDFEMTQISRAFTRSVLIHEPGRTAHWLIERGYDWLFVRSGLLDWIRHASTRSGAASQHRSPDLRYYLSQVAVHLEDYILAAAYTVLVFLVRLLILVMALPLFLAAIFTGFIDGLVRRDIRRFGAGRESGFLHHRAKTTLMPLVVLPWFVYLALPVSVQPLWILLPSAALLALSVDVTVGSFKKYL
ncbi:TIGR03747 family integrating conjugative element membrane protein [Paraburkholderia ginsengisoli]|uniref:TIGR03747 family integrating conjugative element membrane protein n=1 Tax=Paraburkholderia ginsengisoli TaxID=311231 RepID=A0A7T4T945_9BURK|nr:TIGR03747 family integrating conjugative element membrane protein [Paraburkholderia ginsengisoli]QQC64354.1 TIGR03747 family integrating conjugative element membrane protein [Paraburkholderia ginsengisoli]